MSINEKFDTEILGKIKEGHVKPKARWTFLLKDYVVWALGFLSLILGAVAFSVIIYLVKNNDWGIYREFSGSLSEFVILTMPYFWIVFLLIFLVVLNYNLKHTKKGYKFSLPIVMMSSIFVSMFLGIIFFNAGLGKTLDDVLGEKVVFYDRILNPMVRMWDEPEKGRLAGLVIAEVAGGQYRLLDISRNEWLIDINSAEMPRDFMIEIGRPVKLLGESEGEFFFVVKRVFHHEGPGRGMMMHRLRDGMPPPMFMPVPGEMCSSPTDGLDKVEGICPMERMLGTGTDNFKTQN